MVIKCFNMKIVLQFKKWSQAIYIYTGSRLVGLLRNIGACGSSVQLMKEWSEKQLGIPSQNTHPNSHDMVVSGLNPKDQSGKVGRLLGASVVT